MSKPNYPTDAAGFKTWADAACTTWPDHLTAAAYNTRFDGFDKFDALYRAHVLSGSST